MLQWIDDPDRVQHWLVETPEPNLVDATIKLAVWSVALETWQAAVEKARQQAEQPLNEAA